MADIARNLNNSLEARNNTKTKIHNNKKVRNWKQ